MHTRPDIALIASMVARFLANPKEIHVMVIKRIMRCLRGIKEYGLWYNLGGNLNLKVFIDVDWIGSIDDRKSTSGGALFIDKRLVSQTRKKCNCISEYTIEA